MFTFRCDSLRSAALLFPLGFVLGCASTSGRPAPASDPAGTVAPPASEPGDPTAPQRSAPPPPPPLSPDPASADRSFPCDSATLSELKGPALRLTRNAVFARHGRIFSAADLQAAYGAEPWYRPDPAYSDARLSEGDRTCLTQVQLWESAHGVLWRGASDLDGDGRVEPLFLLARSPLLVTGGSEDADNPCDAGCPATLIVGERSVDVPLYWTGGAYFGERTVAVVDLDTGDGRQEVLIRQRAPHWEDPPFLSHIVTASPDALRVTALVPKGYDQGALDIGGDGHLTLEDGDCAETRVTDFHLQPDGRIVEGETRRTLRPDAEDFRAPDGTYACPACPVVYVLGGGEGEAPSERLVGEILRDLATPRRRGWQSLHLPPEAAQPGPVGLRITVRLAEEKGEVTHLDALHLRIGDVRILPRSCGEASAPWCADDGEVLRLAEGEAQRFTFDVPRDLAGMGLWLEALGHYEPVREGAPGPAPSR